jgi:hypothetical protein
MLYRASQMVQLSDAFEVNEQKGKNNTLSVLKPPKRSFPSKCENLQHLR